jgi:hypothetical protein
VQLKPFLLDAWLDQYEHDIEFNLAASTGPSWTVNDILALADEETRHRFLNHKLVYGRPAGADGLRQAIAEMWRVLADDGVALINAAALDVLHGSHSTLTHEVRRYTPARLTERLTTAGFAIERISFTNMTTFPLALAVRWSERMRGRAATASDADLRGPFGPVNAVLSAALAAEGQLLRVANLPIGSSLMCLARKKRGRRANL